MLVRLTQPEMAKAASGMFLKASEFILGLEPRHNCESLGMSLHTSECPLGRSKDNNSIEVVVLRIILNNACIFLLTLSRWVITVSATVIHILTRSCVLLQQCLR